MARATAASKWRRGTLAQDVGQQWENWVSGQNQVAEMRGLLAVSWHNEPRCLPVGGGRFIYASASAADFAGTLGKEINPEWCGKGFAAEAKSRSQARLYLSGITPLQQLHLTKNAAAGGLSLLLAEFRDESSALWRFTRFAIPWQLVPWSKGRKNGADGIAAADLAGWEITAACYLDRFVQVMR